MHANEPLLEHFPIETERLTRAVICRSFDIKFRTELAGPQR